MVALMRTNPTSEFDDKNESSSIEHTSTPEPDDLSDEDAEIVLLALSRECTYCGAKTMPTLTGCDGCRPVRTRELVESDSDLAQFLAAHTNYSELLLVASFWESYCLKNCNDFADYLELLGEEADPDDEEPYNVSMARISEIRKGAELNEEEETHYENWHMKICETTYSNTHSIIEMETELKQKQYFIGDLVSIVKGYGMEATTGPFATIDDVISVMATKMDHWEYWQCFNNYNEPLGDQIAELLLARIPGGSK
jgi:hypothetical protein